LLNYFSKKGGLKMTRFFKMLIFTMLCVVLLAGTAMAGSIAYTGGANIPANVALEAMNAARTFTLATSAGTYATTQANNVASVTITPSTSLASSNLLTVTFTNAGFVGDSVSLCAVAVATPIAVSTSTANNATLLFQLVGNASSSQQVFLTDDPSMTAGNCNSSNASLAVKFQTASAATMASVTYVDLS